MKLEEATNFLKSQGFSLIDEGSGVSVQSVVRYLMDNYDLQEDTVTVQGNEIAVLSGNGKDGFLKVVTGDDNQVYIEFLDDNGINSIKPGALITDLSDIDGLTATRNTWSRGQYDLTAENLNKIEKWLNDNEEFVRKEMKRGSDYFDSVAEDQARYYKDHPNGNWSGD